MVKFGKSTSDGYSSDTTNWRLRDGEKIQQDRNTVIKHHVFYVLKVASCRQPSSMSSASRMCRDMPLSCLVLEIERTVVLKHLV